MDVRFEDGSLARLETDARFTANHSRAIVRSYRKVIAYVRAAGDERDLRAWPGLRFKRLEGDRADQYSMRLNDQFRLIVRLESAPAAKVVVIIAIEDYH